MSKHDTRTADDIERDIANERAQMSAKFNDLQKKFSVDSIMDDIGTMVRDSSGDVGRTVSNAVGRNPTAVVMVGVGLAWLLMGRNRNTDATSDDGVWSDYQTSHRKGRGNRGGMRSPVRSSLQNENFDNQSDQYWYETDEMARGRRHQKRHGMENNDHGSAKASEGSSGLTGTISDAANAVSGAVSSAASSVSHTAADLTSRLSHGLDNLSEEAKARVITARHAAHDARVASQAALQRGTRVASDAFEDHPLVMGGLAIALGAALGSMLPRSRIEDQAVGDTSDRLYAEAQAVFREEQEKAMAVARNAATYVKQELNDIGSDVNDMLPEGKSAVDMVVDRASDAAGRVIDRTSGRNGHSGRNQREG